MTKERLLMVCKTHAFEPSGSQAADLKFRRLLTPADGQLLGRLMFAAYAGSIDDEGETEDQTIEEAEATLAGKYGKPILEASFIAFEKDRPISAVVLTDYEKTGPLLAFSVTDPQYQRQGLAALLIKCALNGLHELKIPELRLVVTAENPAAILYRKLGFEVETPGD